MRQFFGTQRQRRCGDNFNGQRNRSYQQYHREGQCLDDGFFQNQIDEYRQTETGSEDDQHNHDSNQDLLQIGVFVVGTQQRRSLAEERVCTCEFNRTLHFASNDGTAHLAGITLVHGDREGLTGEGGLVHINGALVDSTD